jgi:hypothetical protein
VVFFIILYYVTFHEPAARLPDGRVVCAGGDEESADDDDQIGPTTITAEVLEPPEQGSPDNMWRWRELPARTSVYRHGFGSCVLSDGRFAVFGGSDRIHHEADGGVRGVDPRRRRAVGATAAHA